MMMIPEAWQDRDDLPGPPQGLLRVPLLPDGAVGRPGRGRFTDGRVIGATLDRNGLRPGRWCETKDGHVVLGSEAGLLGIRAARDQAPRPPAARQALPRRPRARADRPRRGGQGGGLDAAALRRVVRAEHRPLLRPAEAHVTLTGVEPTRIRQLAFGYSQEDVRVLIAPMAAHGRRADRLDGQRQRAAGPLRPDAAAVQLLQAALRAGHEPADRPDPRGDRDEPRHRRSAPSATCSTSRPSTRTSWSWTSRSCATTSSRRCATSPTTSSRAHTIDITWPVAEGPDGLQKRIAEICDEAYDARSRRRQHPHPVRPAREAPSASAIPSLLAVAAVHHHLVRAGTRLRAGLVLESGEPREVHHFATLIGFGASAINPYLLLRHGRRDRRRGPRPGRRRRRARAQKNVVKAIGKGLLKTISKMGISTTQSYCGAQIFEAVGLEKDLIDKHFTGTASRIGGIGLDVLARETLDRHATAYPAVARRPAARSAASTPGAATASGTCGTRRRSRCSSTPSARRTAARRTKYDEYAALVNDDATRRSTLRGLMKFRTEDADAGAARGGRAGQGDRQALRHRRDVARLDLDARARDARQGDEPRSAASRTPARAGRTRGASPTTAARRSSRSPPAASA